LTVIALENLDKLDSPLGGIEGGPPFCWKSKNQEVFGVSLPTFFTQESRRGVERAAPQKKHPIKHKKIPAQIMQGFFYLSFFTQTT